jgi:hypothetical protein
MSEEIKIDENGTDKQWRKAAEPGNTCGPPMASLKAVVVKLTVAKSRSSPACLETSGKETALQYQLFT